MNVNIEKEYKILVTKEQFVRLLQEYPQAAFKKQVNTYYDTANLAIRRAHGAMRIRTLEDRFLFTLKRHSAEGVMEYEKDVPANDISAFSDAEIRALLQSISIQGPIQKITELTTYRAVIDTGNAELCFDYNRYGDHEDYEIEYEYKQEHDGLSVFNAILAKAQLTYTKKAKSKIQRALDAYFHADHNDA